MIGRHDRELGDAGKGLRRIFGGERAQLDLAQAQQIGMADLVLEIDLKPVGLIVARRIGLEIRIGPDQRPAQFFLGDDDALLAVDGGMAARQQPFRTPGPTPRMSQTVSTRSMRRRSSVCTVLAKASMVPRSERSRPCATFDMSRWCSMSQATVSTSPLVRPKRGQILRATCAPAIE